jgi:hypothetical protein
MEEPGALLGLLVGLLVGLLAGMGSSDFFAHPARTNRSAGMIQ